MPRPAPRFNDFIGQKKAIDPVRKLLRGAMARNEPLPHVLITGPSGVGKTCLAKALARERGTNLLSLTGKASRPELTDKLTALADCDFLFLDEGHALRPAEQELLFQAIDDGKIPRPAPAASARPAAAVPASAGPGLPTAAEPLVTLTPFSLVLATDRPGQLLNALKKRLAIRVHLDPYPTHEMRDIVAVAATEQGVLLSPQAVGLLVRVCHGLPRQARHLLQQLRLFFPDDHRQLGVREVAGFLKDFGIDRRGFHRLHRKYLRFLDANQAASLATLARHLGTDPDEVESQIEPPLIEQGLIDIGSSGRVLLERGRRWCASRHAKTKPQATKKGPAS
jgi:Holliday junction DNA helicase RuvB